MLYAFFYSVYKLCPRRLLLAYIVILIILLANIYFYTQVLWYQYKKKNFVVVKFYKYNYFSKEIKSIKKNEKNMFKNTGLK